MHTNRSFYIAFTLLLVLALTALTAEAQIELVENGSFETGDFSGWTVVQEPGSAGNWFVYSGNITPLSSSTILPPPDGEYAAVADQLESSSQILYQDIDVPQSSSTTCSFIVYYQNEANEFVIGPSLSYGGGFQNQQGRIDIMDPDAPDFDIGAGVLQNLFQTNPGDPLSLGYTTVVFDLTTFEGTTVRFRAALVNNLANFQFAIDDVTCVTATEVPALSEWGLIAMAGILGIVGFIVVRRNKSLA